MLCFSAQTDRDHFQLGSLSHLLNTKAGGYQELPDWPESAPDPSVRNVEVKDSVRAGGTVTLRGRASGLRPVGTAPPPHQREPQHTGHIKNIKPILSNQNRLLPQPCFISLLAHQHNSTFIMHCHSSWLSASQLALY